MVILFDRRISEDEAVFAHPTRRYLFRACRIICLPTGKCLVGRVTGNTLLHAAPDHPIGVVLDPLVVNRDDMAERIGVVSVWRLPFVLSWLRLATSSSAEIRGRQPYSIVRRMLYVIA